jgi:hypothetical protein
VAARKEADSFISYVHASVAADHFLALRDGFPLLVGSWGLWMSTPRKCLLALLGEQLTSMMQRFVGNAQISRNVR